MVCEARIDAAPHEGNRDKTDDPEEYGA